MLKSPIAIQNRTGRIEVCDASLECGQDAGWLYASPNQNLFIAGYHGPTHAPLTLTVPAGKVEKYHLCLNFRQITTSPTRRLLSFSFHRISHRHHLSNCKCPPNARIGCIT